MKKMVSVPANTRLLLLASVPVTVALIGGAIQFPMAVLTIGAIAVAFMVALAQQTLP